MSMRQKFFDLMYWHFLENDRLFAVTADLGFRYWDPIRNDFPTRFCTTGASEQLAVGVGVGLALEGKIPLVYSITPFVLYRPAEWIRNYLSHEKIPVKLVGSGFLSDYTHDGFTHFCDADLLRIFPEIEFFCPASKEDLEEILPEFLFNDRPGLLAIRR